MPMMNPVRISNEDPNMMDKHKTASTTSKRQGSIVLGLEPHIAPHLVAGATRLYDCLRAVILAAHHASVIVGGIFCTFITYPDTAFIGRDGGIITSAGALARRPSGPRVAHIHHRAPIMAPVPYQCANLAMSGRIHQALHCEVAPVVSGDFSEVPKEVNFHNFVSVFSVARIPGGA